MGLLNGATAPYLAIESWIYDYVVAPAVYEGLKNEVFKEMSHLPQAAKVLDVGSGGGQLLVGMLEKSDTLRVQGVDLSREQVERSKERLRPYGDRCQVIQGSALNLAFLDATFDMVVSLASIKHWPDQAKGLSECLRVLKPGGVLVVCEVDRESVISDSLNFTKTFHLPKIFRPFGFAIFYKLVRKISLSADDFKSLAQNLELNSFELRQIPKMPVLVFKVKKP